MTKDVSFQFSPIGYIHSPFKEKIGMAKQSMMIPQATGLLKLNHDTRFQSAVEDLEGFSHLWVIFVFHKHLEKNWRPKISPPRIDGPERVGVLASRSPHRPNPLGMSALKIEKIETQAPNGVEIHLSGLDLLDGTPVLDIKPYLPFADAFPDAKPGWASAENFCYPVTYSKEALDSIKAATSAEYPQLKELLHQMLELDPRATALRKLFPIDTTANEGRQFGFRFLDFDVQWKIKNKGVYLIDLFRMNGTRDNESKGSHR
ncbi:MAG: tRNA (N6-threonylcarbamoyladenosine(37)-N6)-methyltransferase TrmO [Deltaproteobacteria bacterium CG11_big_fil_rev_8_21_14_0_20_45_16]|nr:MAG: tRNA (N6-threonylcarbamoyladenosine(37)-N6)-methyltransferase TrmO [Deltaproteobacteria bacterium CG11_big_fil_rev_8_21_14_0_20_45_16]